MRIIALLLLVITSSVFSQPVLKVVATTPELGSLVKEIGTSLVEVKTLVKGREDPHYVEVLPSYVAAVNKADLVVKIGLELEIGWLPVVIQQSRNQKVQKGKPGHLDVSDYIVPIETIDGPIHRGMGHIHPKGNPHYLSDPSQGLLAAGGIKSKLQELIPSSKAQIEANYNVFKKRLGTYLLGEKLVAKYDSAKLLELRSYNSLIKFLKSKNEEKLLGGQLKRFGIFQNKPVVQGHGSFSSLIRFLGLKNNGTLEPKPGIKPSFKYLATAVKKINYDGVKLVTHTPFFSKRLIRFVESEVNCPVVELGTKMNSVKSHEDYLDWVQWTLDTLYDGLTEDRS